MALVALVALVGVGLYAAQLPVSHRWARGGLALILGGAAGNLVDRARQGYVVDFVDAYWNGWHFWAFNVADAAISVGVGLLDHRLVPVGGGGAAGRRGAACFLNSSRSDR